MIPPLYLPEGMLGQMPVKMPLAFPLHVSIDDTGEIVLNADGSWTGDGAAFIAALNHFSGSSDIAVTLWLVANAIRSTPPLLIVPPAASTAGAAP